VFEPVVVDVEVVLRHDSKGANGSERAALLAVQLVDMVTMHDQLALLAARQVEVSHQTFARVVFAIPFVVHACAAVLLPVTVARVISRIEHGCPPDMALRWVVREGARAVAARGDQEGAERSGRCAARRSGRSRPEPASGPLMATEREFGPRLSVQPEAGS
jgi:hypothetical protein